MENVRCVAVDWSGSIDVNYQLPHIWMAEVQQNELVRLRNGLTHREVIDYLIQDIIPRGPVIIGLDFAFGFPQWYQHRHNLNGAQELWGLAERKGEAWLGGHVWPFWGRPGPYQQRPNNLGDEFLYRRTDVDHQEFRPQCVFKTNGVGAVGTGTIRGLPELARLQQGGAVIWPFADANPLGANVIEIYPRLLYGRPFTNNNSVRGRDSRRDLLAIRYPCLEQHWRDTMIGSPDAFDAAVSALVMGQYSEELRLLQGAPQPPYLVEGEMWPPQQLLNQDMGIFPPV